MRGKNWRVFQDLNSFAQCRLQEPQAANVRAIASRCNEVFGFNAGIAPVVVHERDLQLVSKGGSADGRAVANRNLRGATQPAQRPH